MSLGELV